MAKKELRVFKVPEEDVRNIAVLMDKTAPGQYGNKSTAAAYDLWDYIGVLYSPVLEEGVHFSIEQRGVKSLYIVETKKEKTDE